jgi:hypothetical protein
VIAALTHHMVSPDNESVPIDVVESRMRPGRFSQTGFLGPEESLVRVIEDDARTLNELGLSAAELAGTLESLLVAAIDSTPTSTTAGRYIVIIQRYKGPQICPFAPQPHKNPCLGPGDRRLASIDWRITNPRNGLKLQGPGLIAHLIAAHSFFEGTKSPYRVPPKNLAQLLELGPFKA